VPIITPSALRIISYTKGAIQLKVKHVNWATGNRLSANKRRLFFTGIILDSVIRLEVRYFSYSAGYYCCYYYYYNYYCYYYLDYYYYYYYYYYYHHYYYYYFYYYYYYYYYFSTINTITATTIFTTIITTTITTMGRDSTVVIATGYGLDGPRIESGGGEIFRTRPDQP
jgi:hypothetical protein